MNIRPKKHWGQNFLIDQNIQKKIIASCGLKKTDIVLEIGSGTGQMTKPLCEHAGFVYALEIDPDLCRVLKLNLQNFNNIEILHHDILKLNFSAYFKNLKKRLKIFGNIPYYISSPIIEHLIKHKDKIDVIFITAQKEFAKRIASYPGSKNYGALSCFAQFYTEPSIIFSISKNCFRPVPKVDSCLLRIEPRRESPVEITDEKMLFKVIRAGFNKRRKTLRNSLEDIISQEALENFFTQYGINKNIRPEDLSLQDFAKLANCASIRP